MNLWLVFLVAALGGGVGAVLGMAFYVLWGNDPANEAAEAYEAGYAAASEHWRAQMERLGVGMEKAA